MARFPHPKVRWWSSFKDAGRIPNLSQLGDLLFTFSGGRGTDSGTSYEVLDAPTDAPEFDTDVPELDAAEAEWEGDSWTLTGETDGASESRLQRRLKDVKRRDRTFLKTIRQRRARPSRLNQRLTAYRGRQVLLRRAVVGTALGLSLGSITWVSLFLNERVTLGGVPYGIVNKFWNDRVARSALFAGDRQALHDRLDALGVEEDIKRYYRSRFETEHELDLYIHQLMFDRTGYVGEAYEVDNYGKLHPRRYVKSEPADVVESESSNLQVLE